jgi:hypothetical protein
MTAARAQAGRDSESARIRLHGRAKAPVCEGRISAESASCRGAAVSLSKLPALGLKLAQAEQGQPVQMGVPGQQLARALVPALGMAATQEAAMVEEEAQQLEV